MNPSDKALLDFLEKMVNENRLELLDKIMQGRTRYVTVVLEDLFQPHNASAVLRTCDCFGIQDIHIVADDPIIGFNNIMYTVHFYAATHGKELRKRSEYAMKKGIPGWEGACSAITHRRRRSRQNWKPARRA